MVRKLPFRTVPFQEWLPDDQLAWHTATYLSDLFDDPGPLSHASPEHQVKLIAAHGRWLGFLEEHTRRAAPEGDRETIEVFIKLLSEFLAPHSVFHYCRDLCLVLQAIHPRHELPTLETAVRNLARTRRAVTDKRSRLVPVAELYALGHDLMHEPVHHEVALKRAATYRDGLMIALLSSRPMRLKNLASIEIGRHLDRRGRRYWLDFPAREVKNRRALEFPLPHELTEYIETYLSEVRPVLLEGYGRWKCDPGGSIMDIRARQQAACRPNPQAHFEADSRAF